MGPALSGSKTGRSPRSSRCGVTVSRDAIISTAGLPLALMSHQRALQIRRWGFVRTFDLDQMAQLSALGHARFHAAFHVSIVAPQTEHSKLLICRLGAMDSDRL
jgi:hypothetical protein